MGIPQSGDWQALTAESLDVVRASWAASRSMSIEMARRARKSRRGEFGCCESLIVEIAMKPEGGWS
jgi:hypothetical protein